MNKKKQNNYNTLLFLIKLLKILIFVFKNESKMSFVNLSEPIRLNQPFLFDPPLNCAYQLEKGEWKTIVVLTGDDIPQKLSWIHFQTLVFNVENMTHGPFQWTFSHNLRLISKESIFGFQNEEELPPILFYAADYVHNVVTCTLLTVNLSTNEVTIEGCTPVMNVEVCNDSLQKECQSLLRDIPVRMGEYPIFASKIKPSLEEISAIYQNFIEYNNDMKLDHQYQLSSNLCHIRAHFGAVFLSQYGIPVQKVYKVWNEIPDFSWSFHAGLMIIDNKERKWVWDPWLVRHKRLVSLQEWTICETQPLPVELVIANQVVIADFDHGSRDDASVLEFGFPEHMIQTFRYFCSEANPNIQYLT